MLELLNFIKNNNNDEKEMLTDPLFTPGTNIENIM